MKTAEIDSGQEQENFRNRKTPYIAGALFIVSAALGTVTDSGTDKNKNVAAISAEQQPGHFKQTFNFEKNDRPATLEDGSRVVDFVAVYSKSKIDLENIKAIDAEGNKVVVEPTSLEDLNIGTDAEYNDLKAWEVQTSSTSETIVQIEGNSQSEVEVIYGGTSVPQSQ